MAYLAKQNPDELIEKLGFYIFGIFLFLIIVMPILPNNMTTSAGGAVRWIRLTGFSLAPVEFLKIGFVLFLAWSLTRKFEVHKDKSVKAEITKFSPYIGLFALIFVPFIYKLQNDLGQIVLLATTTVLMFLFAGSTFKTFIVLIGSTFALMLFFIFTSDHRIHRVESWWNGVTGLTEPYQVSYSLNAINNGGFFGQGLGNGTYKLGFLSEVHTDFILSGITEEIGFFGLVIVTLLILAIVLRIFKIANRVENKVYFLFCIGVGLLIAISFFINAFGISGIAPVKGMAVPFVSYGGSSLLALSIAIGMVLSISKKARL